MKKNFLAIVSFSIISFIGIGIVGYNDKKSNGEDFLYYKQAMINVEKGLELDNAIKIVDKMQDKETRENYIFNIDKGNIYIKKREYKKAIDEYGKAVKNNIKLKKDVKFLITYSKIALEAKEYELSKNLIISAKNIGLDEQLSNEANEILSKLE